MALHGLQASPWISPGAGQIPKGLLSLNGGFPTHGAKPRHGPRDRPTSRHGPVRKTIGDHRHPPSACRVRLRRADRRRGSGCDIHSHSGGSCRHGVYPRRRDAGIDVHPPSPGETLRNDLRSRQTSRSRHGQNAASHGARLRSDPRDRHTSRCPHGRSVPNPGARLPNDPRNRQTSRGFGPRCGHPRPGCGWKSGDPSSRSSSRPRDLGSSS